MLRPIIIISLLGILAACNSDKTIVNRGTCLAKQNQADASLGLAESGFSDAAGQFLATENPKFDLLEKENSYHRVFNHNAQGLGLTASGSQIESTNFDFSVMNIPLCHYNATVSRMGNEMFLIGTIPKGNPDVLSGLEFPSLEEAAEIVGEKVKIGSGEAEDFETRRRCFILKDKALLPALEVGFRDRGNEYLARIYREFSEKKSTILTIETISPDFFTQTAAATVYLQTTPANAVTSQTTYATQDVTIENIADQTLLCDNDFVTSSSTSSKRIYSFIQDSHAFGETTLFYNAKANTDWILSLGILTDWPQPQITLKAVDIGLDEGNPAYHPNSQGGPKISLYLKDSTSFPSLQNLWYDPDVIAHEANHHLVYQRLTQVTKGTDAVAIHEALADYLVMAKTGRTCFAPTVCVGSSTCINENCLRDANNQMAMDNLSAEDQEDHRKGQVISGMLWDIQKEIDVATSAKDPYTVAKIVLTAVNFFSAKMDFTGFLIALIKADAGQHTAILKSHFCSRGFTTQIAESTALQTLLGGKCN